MICVSNCHTVLSSYDVQSTLGMGNKRKIEQTRDVFKVVFFLFFIFLLWIDHWNGGRADWIRERPRSTIVYGWEITT